MNSEQRNNLRKRSRSRGPWDQWLGGGARRRRALGRGLFTPITTPRCIIRLGALRDAPAFAHQAGQREIAEWMLNFPSPFPVVLAEQRIQNSWQFLGDGKAVSLVVIDRKTGELVGGVALNNLKALPEPELAYWVAKSHWGQGLGLEITTAIIDYAFEQRGDVRLRASVLHGNTPSVHLLNRLGFHADGVEFVMAEPYAPTVGLQLDEVLSHHQNTGSSLVQMGLNRWILTREDWLRRKAV